MKTIIGSILFAALLQTAPALADEPTALGRAVDGLTETTGEVLGDLLFRFHKCSGDLSVLERRGWKPEKLSRPYVAFDGMLTLFRDEALALTKRFGKTDYSVAKNEWMIWRLVWRARVLSRYVDELKGKTKEPRHYTAWSDALKTLEEKAAEEGISLKADRQRFQGAYWTLLQDLADFRSDLRTAVGVAIDPELADDLQAALESTELANATILKVEMKKSPAVDAALRKLRLVNLVVSHNAERLHQEAMNGLGTAAYERLARVLALNEYVTQARTELVTLIRPVGRRDEKREK